MKNINTFKKHFESISNQECELIKSGEKYDCRDMYNCCDCGGSNCGCNGCYSCNACDSCKGNPLTEGSTSSINMKDLLIKALDDAFALLERQVPQIKSETKSLSIQGVNPLELTKFMKDNDIPDNAYFDGRDNSVS